MYADEVSVEVNSILSGKHTDIESLSDLKKSDIDILRAFAEDIDLQYMQIVSTNIGMIRTYQKRLK